MSLAKSRAFEDPRNALEIVVAPAESSVRRSRDVGLAQDVRWNRSSGETSLADWLLDTPIATATTV